MATEIRAELSEKNKYYIEKHRYYELKHYCLQYPNWKKTYLALDGYDDQTVEMFFTRSNKRSDPTAKYVNLRELYSERINLIDHIACAADPDIAEYILKGVTEGLSYTKLKSQYDIPCGRDMYYDRYRRFFWLLNEARG